MDTPTHKIAIVASVHIQPSVEWIKSLESVTQGKNNVEVFIVDDSDGVVELPNGWKVFDYKAQREEMGDAMYERFEKFHKSSACKNFGHWYAWKEGFDVVIGIDSDCIVPPGLIHYHLSSLMLPSYGWTNPITRSGWFPRGFPYSQRQLRTALSLGLWEGELDLYGADRLEKPTQDTRSLVQIEDSAVADGILPLSGMNWACWSDIIPGLCFLPNFEIEEEMNDHNMRVTKFRRHDDIWGGYIFQALMASRNERIRYGKPVVFHQTVVDPAKDAEEEKGMIAFENMFYAAVDSIVPQIENGMYEDMMLAFASIAQKEWKGTEFEAMADAVVFWAELFDTSNRNA